MATAICQGLRCLHSTAARSSASVAFEDDRAVLERTYKQIPPGCSVTLFADRGFDRQHLLQWLQAHQWEWVIRLKGGDVFMMRPLTWLTKFSAR